MNQAIIFRRSSTFLVRYSSFIFGCLLGLASSSSAADSRPNILFIMSDDHAAHAIGAYGGRLAPLNPTPTLDRSARLRIRRPCTIIGELLPVTTNS